MKPIFFVSTALIAVCLSWQQAEGHAPQSESTDFFEKKVRPLLVTHCYSCHSNQAKKVKGGLKLDSREGLLKGGDGGPVVLLGKPEESPLIQAIRHEGQQMPPGKKLPAGDIETLAKWVALAAPWPEESSLKTDKTTILNWSTLRQRHWAWQRVKSTQPPVVHDASWVQSPLDRFVLHRLEAAGMKPAPAADRATLIRRASLDLVGLPPTPAEVAAFVEDNSSQAFEKVVERLLASPHYGERWARYWLDVAHYSDGFGNGFDGPERPQAYRYRDWVVEALNRDLPYDQFIKQQVAGDLMGGPETAVATGFLVLGPLYTSDGGDPDSVAKAKAETLDDRIDTISRGLLGLTVSCARCHDHKFDPIPTRDYYSLAGVINSTREQDLPLTNDEAARRYREAKQALRDLEERVKTMDTQARNAAQPPTPEEKKALSDLRAELSKLKKTPLPPMPPIVHALAEGRGADMPIAIRGDLRKAGEAVPRQFLRILAGETPPRFTDGSGRMELANALADPDNPLTARVFVNRVWMGHFGKALVRTPDNFGTLGEKPTHPELLDWLAHEFVHSGWSLKQLHRRIMLSATYQMSGAFHRANFDKDGDNRLLWRFEPRRLDVEAWRDSLLAVTGELDTKQGGLPQTKLLQNSRRTLYTVISRNGDKFESDQFLRLFDFPIARTVSVERNVSTVPQQYLFLMNSPFMIERSKALAERLSKESSDASAQTQAAYRLLYGRAPTAEEMQLGLVFLSREKGSVSRWRQYAQVLLSSHEFMQIR